MVAPLPPPAALHPLTPGSPLYGMLKIGAIGAIVGLRFVLVRRNKAQDETAEPEAGRGRAAGAPGASGEQEEEAPQAPRLTGRPGLP